MHDINELKKRYIEAKKKLFEKVFGERLNPRQCQAVFTAKGPLLVLAGAGSGKTTVLVNRIAYLIKYGNAYFSDDIPDVLDKTLVDALEAAYEMSAEEISHILPEFISEPCPPWSVLAITFTNKAAREIKERLLNSFEEKAIPEAIWAGTFHSICVKILRKYSDRLGYREGFSIYDTDDKKRMIAMCMRELEIDEKRLAPKAVGNEISRAKDRLVSAEEYENEVDARSRDIAAIYKLYQKKMIEYNAVDFDDIIMKTVELFENEPDVLCYYQNKFKYVLVDEYQDTNHAQFVLTKLISEGSRNIMVVGDDDQSIYRFRGATVENILDFDKTYPEATVIKLEQNYRSTENILAAANAIIKNNDRRHGKKLWSERGEGEKITVHEAADQNDEGRYIIDRISAGIKKDGKKYSDYAVLYRTNALGRALQTSFAKSGVPYKILGDMGFYDRKEVKDMIAYLTVLNSSGDNLRLKRIINEPKRKIGTACVEAVEAIASAEGLSMYEVVKSCERYELLSKNVSKLKAFSDMIEGIKEKAATPSEMISEVFVKSGYRAMLTAEGFEGEGRIEMVEEFINAAAEFEKRAADAGSVPELSEFLEEIALISDVDKYDESADAVVLMTVHSAKGLEFSRVFIAGMEDGIFPSEQSRGEPDELSEERRLAYVAITRAKEKLYITHTKTRMTYGKTCYNRLSCFVREELPESLIERDLPKAPPPRQSTYSGSYRQEKPKISVSDEFSRPVDIGISFGGCEKNYNTQRQGASPYGTAARPVQKPRGAEAFGVEKIQSGARVLHSIFGEGVIISSRDMGGDILYEVRFDSGQTKKLMATFAKLKKL